MAKKKESKDPLQREHDLIESSLAFHQAKFGKEGVYIGADTDRLMAGIPLPSLALEWLIGMNIWPQKKVTGMSGPPGTMKTSFGHELMRWAAPYGAYFRVGDTEGLKFSPTLARSIVGPAYEKQFLAVGCSTSDEAQKFYNDVVAYNKDNNLGKSPFVFMIDSLTGADTQEGRSKFEEEGSLGRGHAVSAISWTNFFKNAPQQLLGAPCFLYFTNHLKTQISSMPGRPPPKKEPGGDAQRFLASLYLRSEKVADGQRQTMRENGEEVRRFNEYVTVKLTCVKNSYGTTGRSISADMVWWRRPSEATKKTEQVTRWEWAGSTARLLHRMQNSEESLCDKKLLKEMCDVARNQQGRYSSKRLGLDGLADYELGQAIEADAQLRCDLQQFLGIFVFPTLETQEAR